MHLPITHYRRIIQSIFANPNGWESDIIVAKNLDFLKSFSNILLKLFPVETDIVYRGVLLENHYKAGDLLKSINGRFYTSFSSSPLAALEFADPNSPLAFLLKLQGKTSGFIIKHSPKPTEILFHHTWGEKMNFYTGIYNQFQDQKEVILFNDVTYFRLENTYEL